MEKIMMSMKHLGKCSVCHEEKEVVTFGNTKTRKVAFVCKDCSEKLNIKTIEFVDKYGKTNEEPFGMKIEIISNEKKICG